ncbi:MAG: hypothetical protein ACTHK7_01385, partial [Aureliella sp.]
FFFVVKDFFFFFFFFVFPRPPPPPPREGVTLSQGDASAETYLHCACHLLLVAIFAIMATRGILEIRKNKALATQRRSDGFEIQV